MNEYQKVVEDLRKYKGLKVFIQNAEELIELYSQDNPGIKAITYDSINSKTNNVGSSVESEVVNKKDNTERLEKKIKEAQSIIDKIDRSLEILNDIDKKILILKYMDGQPWFKIASEVSMSERQCKRNRNESIKRLIIPFFGNSGRG